MLMVLLKRK